MTDPKHTDDPLLPGQAAAVPEREAPVLTGRQRQILELLRAGKVNKEIANELGIGLGTVKQHVVAIFKKLKVRNRAMAVSRGQEPAARAPGAAPLRVADGMLERRPCVVLSLALPDTVPGNAGRLLHQTLATYAFDHDALFLARKGNAGDLIFGIQRPTEHDLLLVLRAAHIVYAALAAHDGSSSSRLQGGLTAGMVIASMERRGGWSGEAIASPAIAQARELAARVEPGRLRLDAPARELLLALSPCASARAPGELDIAELDCLPWQLAGEPLLLVGREAELGRLDALIDAATGGAGCLVYLEGETGMGKSSLCHHAATEWARRRGRVQRFVCVPDNGSALIHTLPDGRPSALDAVLEVLAGGPKGPAVIVDDCHLLPHEVLVGLTQRAAKTAGRLVLLSGRRFPEAAAAPAEVLRLGRLSQDATEALATRTLGAAGAALAPTIARMATGVPLFVLQLARQRERSPLPLPLRFVIGARIEKLALDRLLLRCVARATKPVSTAELAAAMDTAPAAVTAALTQAVAGGVLRRDDKDRFSFTHPLLRQAVAEAQVE